METREAAVDLTWRGDLPIPAVIRRREQGFIHQWRLRRGRAVSVPVAIADVGEKADRCLEGREVGEVLPAEGRQEVGVVPIVGATAMRQGHLRQEVGGDHEIDCRIGLKARQHAAFPAGEIGDQRLRPDSPGPKPSRQKVHGIDEDDTLETFGQSPQRHVADETGAEHDDTAPLRTTTDDAADEGLTSLLVRRPSLALAQSAGPQREGIADEAQSAEFGRRTCRRIQKRFPDHGPSSAMELVKLVAVEPP